MLYFFWLGAVRTNATCLSVWSAASVPHQVRQDPDKLLQRVEARHARVIYLAATLGPSSPRGPFDQAAEQFRRPSYRPAAPAIGGFFITRKPKRTKKAPSDGSHACFDLRTFPTSELSAAASFSRVLPGRGRQRNRRRDSHEIGGLLGLRPNSPCDGHKHADLDAGA
jgi:hypothetical protein